MTMVGGAQYVVPHRKPVPVTSIAVNQGPKIVPDCQLPLEPEKPFATATKGAPVVPLSAINTPAKTSTETSSHRHTRTSSSSVFPNMPPSKQGNPVSHHYSMVMNPYGQNRRTLSNATTSTSTTGGGMPPARTGSSASASLRRSGSSRSQMSNIGYVASMRKQKATVWCDRSQSEDPRLIAQKKALKERLNWDGASRQSNPALNSLGTRAKIVNPRRAPAAGYNPADFVGGVGGVPMRLSASEVGDDAGSDDDDSARAAGHHRTGSGRSSLGSGRRHAGTALRPMNPSGVHRLSQGSTPPNANGPPTTTSSNEGSSTKNTPMPSDKADYFSQPSSTGISGESGSSGDRENSFGNIGKLSPRAAALAREKSTKNPEELRRRGSIDERTSTMTGVRLYIANPDLSD